MRPSSAFSHSSISSQVIDSAGGEDGKERGRGEREKLFYMLQPLHYAVEETALFQGK